MMTKSMTFLNSVTVLGMATLLCLEIKNADDGQMVTSSLATTGSRTYLRASAKMENYSFEKAAEAFEDLEPQQKKNLFGSQFGHSTFDDILKETQLTAKEIHKKIWLRIAYDDFDKVTKNKIKLAENHLHTAPDSVKQEQIYQNLENAIKKENDKQESFKRTITRSFEEADDSTKHLPQKRALKELDQWAKGEGQQDWSMSTKEHYKLKVNELKKKKDDLDRQKRLREKLIADQKKKKMKKKKKIWIMREMRQKRFKSS
jgi:hypothetical protein